MSNVTKTDLGETIWLMLRALEDAEAKHSNNWSKTYSLQQRISIITEELGELARECNDLSTYMSNIEPDSPIDAWSTVSNITEESYQLLAVVFRFVLTWRDEQNVIRENIRRQDSGHNSENN